VGSHWPSVVASAALLVATDALSSQRTVGTYMLSACDFSKTQLISKTQLADFALLHGSATSMMTLAVAYDDTACRVV